MVDVGDIVFPGDIISKLKSKDCLTFIGPGLNRITDSNDLEVTRIGKLAFKSPNTYWVESVSKRYIPKRGDLVIGIVTRRTREFFRVNIGSNEMATLSMSAFENASKRRNTDVKIGDIVYARILHAHREMEPELVCINSQYKAGKLGLLSKDGFMITVSLNLVYRLLDINCPLLKTLGKKYVYEIAIGMNGRVWINAQSWKDILIIISALQAAEDQDNKKISKICRKN